MKMTTKQQKLNDYKRKYPESFEPNRLDSRLTTLQLWSGGTMLTAQLSLQDAINGVRGGSYFVISGQAVGTVSSLLD